MQVRVEAKDAAFYKGRRIRKGTRFHVNEGEVASWMHVLGGRGGAPAEAAHPVSQVQVKGPRPGDEMREELNIEAPGEGEEDRQAKINLAVGKLDHQNDTHWNKNGTPKVAVLSKLAGVEITLKDLDGLNIERRAE